tara:strand:- start:445 stop:591 length:147 start_codon:yes stop_codon:yes gene_type:complete
MSREGTGALVVFTSGLLSMALFGVWHVLGTLIIMFGAAALAESIINDA